MSEEIIEELGETQPGEEEGVFYVSQIYPNEEDEELKPEGKDAAEVEDDAAEDAEDDTNSYQTAPAVSVKPQLISDIAHRLLEKNLKGKKYDPSYMKKVAFDVSSILRDKIKKLKLDRYRIISQVTVGEKCSQDIFMNFLYLWKHEFDHYVIATYEETSFFAAALVFLVYKQ